jgi:hypothetical protein
MPLTITLTRLLSSMSIQIHVHPVEAANEFIRGVSDEGTVDIDR